jgi:GNAT superfamily N-acetyltransferase
MWWRVPAKEFEREAGPRLRERFRELVAAGRTPGLLAYRDGAPVGWCSVAPRPEFGRLQRSPKLRPVDATPVWSVVCFYVDRHHRSGGVARALLEGAVAHALAEGAEVVEGYPLDPVGGRTTNAQAFTGVLDLFLAAGFEEVARRGGRPVVRRARRSPTA